MNGVAVSRRVVLKAVGATAGLAAMGRTAEATADPDHLPDCRLSVFHDYARWALMPAADPLSLKADRVPGDLVVTEMAPSLLGVYRNRAILRPAAIATLPVSTLVALVSEPKAIVVDTASAAPGAATAPVSWERLAEVMAAPGMPLQKAVLDLGGRTVDDKAIRAGAAIFEHTFAKLTRGKRAAVSIHGGPCRNASQHSDDKTASAWL